MTELDTAAAGHHFPDAIHDQAITVAAPVCVLSDRDGQIRPTGVTGVFVSDLRVLRRAELVPSVGHLVHLGSSASGPTSASANSLPVASRSPAAYLAWAAISARDERSAASGVNATARSQNAAAAATPPRPCARSADPISFVFQIVPGPILYNNQVDLQHLF